MYLKYIKNDFKISHFAFHCWVILFFLSNFIMPISNEEQFDMNRRNFGSKVFLHLTQRLRVNGIRRPHRRRRGISRWKENMSNVLVFVEQNPPIRIRQISRELEYTILNILREHRLVIYFPKKVNAFLMFFWFVFFTFDRLEKK